MNRNIKKLHDEYMRHCNRREDNRASFYMSDIRQIKESATRPDGRVDLFDAICDALEAGYMVGYKVGRNDAM